MLRDRSSAVLGNNGGAARTGIRKPINSGLDTLLEHYDLAWLNGQALQSVPSDDCRMLRQIRPYDFEGGLRHWSVSQISRQQHPRLARRCRLKILAKLREQAFPDRCAERCRSLSVD